MGSTSTPTLHLPSSPPLPPSSLLKSSTGSRPLPARPSPKLPPLPPNGVNPSPPLAGSNSGKLPGLLSPTSSAPPTPVPKPPPDLSSLPLAPLPHHLYPFLTPASPLNPSEKRQLFTSTYLRCSSSGNADVLEWLLALPQDPTLSSQANAAAQRRRMSLASVSDFGEREEVVLEDHVPRKWVDLETRDEEGNTALGLCTALGHAEGVRVIVEAGANVEAGDRAGWTPLHWAVQNNDIPIAAYLLNHRASPLATSNKGLTPRDLVKRGDEGFAMREVLKSAYEAAIERERMLLGELDEEDEMEELSEGARPTSRASFASSIMTPSWAHDPAKVEEERREREGKKRMELAAESARCLEVDLGVLGWGGRGAQPAEDDEELGISNPFIWNTCLPDQMLVFSLADLPTIFDVVITTMKPVRQRTFRTIPANVVFLSARYAHYHGTPELLEELVVGAMERIEAAVHHRPDDMANCSFWLSNCLLLLYYLRKEPNLHQATREMQVHLCDLINEIFVFIIRDAERRIDRVLEPAILEHEALPGFEDVSFEGEWSSNRFVKKLTGGRSKKSGMSKSASAMSLFGGEAGGAEAAAAAGAASGLNGSATPPGEATPRNVTSLLSSTLFVLQSYEIPPSIVVQAFSQLFYWIACEVFNRLLTQRKYLCRSKAMQIRLNASNLEDWARSNRMPTKMTSVHFAPLNQLLQWLQCLSSEASIDGLIGTIQSLRSLNPLQLRRAVREYRYEVDETRMDEDCSQYLLQIQKQWERMRLQKTVDGLGGPGSGGGGEVMSRASSGSTSSETSEERREQENVMRMIDDVFADPSGFGSYTPPGGSEALGELLNSRYMLPFAVPSSAEMLLNFHSRDAFGPFADNNGPYAPTSSGGTLTPSHSTTSLVSAATASRRASLAPSISSSTSNAHRRSSVASSAASDGGEPRLEERKEFTPVLPDSFWEVMDEARQQARVRAAAAAVKVTPEERIRDWVQGANGATGLGFGEAVKTPGLESVGTPVGGVEGTWFDWRQNMPDEDAEGKGSESGSDLPAEGDSSFEQGVQETPRAMSGPFVGGM